MSRGCTPDTLAIRSATITPSCIALCASHGLAIISDEVFRDYVISPRSEAVWTLTSVTEALTFTLHGLSKAVGLPQMKLAWMIANGPSELVREAMQRLEK